MIWMLSAAFLGLIVGYISHAYQKPFLTGLFLISPIALILHSRVLLPLAAAANGLDGLDRLEGVDPITLSLELFRLFPENTQSAVIIFAITIFIGRLATWFHSILTAEPEVEETKLERKNRILTQYNKKDGLPN